MNGLKVLTAEEQVANILRADARRVRWLTRLTVSALVLAALLSALLFAVFQGMYQFAAHADVLYTDQLQKEGVKGNFRPTPDGLALARAVSMNAQVTFMLRIAAAGGLVCAVAALGTVWLVHVSRRATLRQIQASLAEIAAQLGALQASRERQRPE